MTHSVVTLAVDSVATPEDLYDIARETALATRCKSVIALASSANGANAVAVLGMDVERLMP